MKKIKMGVLDAIQKNCEPKKIDSGQLGASSAAPAAIATSAGHAQPGRTSGSLGPSEASESSESPGPSGASGSSGWPGYGPQVPPSPCRSCGTPAAWELVYDGTLRCPECEPPPGRSFAKAWWTIRLRRMEPGDVIPPGFATARFSGAGLVPEWIEMDAPKRI